MSSPYPRGAGRRLCAAAVLGTGLVVAGPAMADSGDAEVGWLNAPPIKVESDGSKYTQVDAAAAPIQGGISVQVDAWVSGRVKSWTAWPLLSLVQDEWHDFEEYGHSRSYDIPRPKAVDDGYSFFIPRTGYAIFMVWACNQHAADLRQQGLSDSQIFGQNRQVQIAVSAGLTYETTGLAGTPNPTEVVSWEDLLKVTAVCQRHETLDAPTAGPVTGANLTVGTTQVNQATGACVLGLHGTISALPNMPIKFRYVDAGGQQSDLKTVMTDANGLAEFGHSYPLAPGIKSGKIQMVGQGPVFLSNWAEFESDCSTPPQGEAAVLPPKATHLEAIATGDNVMHRGLVCPAKVKIWGVLKGRGTVSGAAALFAGGQLKTLQQYSIEDGQTVVVEGEHALTWGPTQAQQSVKFAMNVTNAVADIVDQKEVTQNFVCRKPETAGVAQGAVGGVTTGKPSPTHSQQAAVGGLAQPQDFAIQAPQGVARKGEIRLSGGAANARYTLTFLRKNGGGYVKVQSAQLPKQMTGFVASFPLKALTGGRAWRLEVCPAGGVRTACKTADFRLPHIGGGAGAKAPAPADGQPQPNTVYIAPGTLQ